MRGELYTRIAKNYARLEETQLVVAKADKAEDVVIKLNALNDFTENFNISVNGTDASIELDKGFAVLRHPWKTGDVIDVSFDETMRFEGTINKENTSEKQKRLFYGARLCLRLRVPTTNFLPCIMRWLPR
jgi:DUF1680 family protein